MSDTPETDKNTWSDSSEGILYKVVTSDFARKLERERDDYMERCRFALSERDSWRMRAEQKYAMRRELEELLGVDRNNASDEQFQKGLDAIKNIIRERDTALAALSYGKGKTLLNKWLEAIRERDEARKILLEIANASHFDNIGNWARNKAREALEEAK